MPEISVIIPVYNVKDYIQRTIESLLAQTFQNVEIIFVDDCSEDGSYEYLKRYVTERAYMRLLRMEHNSGAACCRNFGLKHATGRYVIFLDADDYFYPNMLEKVYAKICETDADMVVFSFEQYDLKEGGQYDVFTLLMGEGIVAGEEVSVLDYRRFAYAPWNKLIDKGMLERHNIQFQNIPSNNDVLFSLECFTYADKIATMNDILVRYYFNRKGSISSNKREKDYAIDALIECLKFANREDITKHKRNVLLHRTIEGIRQYVVGAEYKQENKSIKIEKIRKTNGIINVLNEFVRTVECSKGLAKFISLLTSNISAEQFIDEYTRENLLKKWISMEHENGRKVAIWGCGRLGTKWIQSIQGAEERFDYIIDSKPTLHGKKIGENVVQRYEDVQDKVDSILLMIPSKNAEEEIRTLTVGKKVTVEDDLWNDIEF